MTDSPSWSRSGYWARVLDHAIFMRLREMATPSEILCPSGVGGAPASALSTHISWSRARVVRMSVKLRAPMRKKSPLGRYCTRRNPAWAKWPVSRRIVLVATSTSKASPKLLAMNATRLWSGDQEGRSPKPVSWTMFDGSCDSGLPALLDCAPTEGGSAARTASAAVDRARYNDIGEDIPRCSEAATPCCAAPVRTPAGSFCA